MTNLIIDINKMFDNEDSDFDQNLNQDLNQNLNQNLNLDSDLNLEILNLLSQIPNQDIYLTPNQDNKNLNSSKE
jgi:hypothetical protein